MTQAEDSYAGCQGYEGNEGVISVRFFKEKIQPIKTVERQEIFNEEPYDPALITPIVPWYPSNPIDHPFQPTYTWCKTQGELSSEVRPSENSICRSLDLGTTWGEKAPQKVKSVEFEVGDYVGEDNLYYASRNRLKEIGISFKKEVKVSLPKGFSDFAPPPKGWVC